MPVDPAARPHDDSSIIVGFRPGARAADRSAVAAAVGATRSDLLVASDAPTYLLHLATGRSVAASLDALRSNPNVRFAEPDYVQTADVESNDPYVTAGGTWGMYGDASTPANAYGSQAAEAWSAGSVGSSGTYVVVIDEGVDVNHVDLADNIWTNPYETLNGVDDDGNGFVDDVHGWDFVANDASVFDGSADDHGTHVAGTIGAVGGNGIGVAGVNWDVTLIPAKFLGTSGGLTSNAVRAIDYAIDLKVRHGLNVVAASNSWGGGGFSQSLLDAINRAGDAGIVFVVAAGNNSTNNDGTPYYPAGYQCTTTAAGRPRGWDCLVTVASITNTGAKSDFSNYGAVSVDLGAPGSAVMSTLPYDTYGSYSGTSMATPHVSGAVALCASANPALGAREIRTALLDTVAPTPSLAGITTTGGRLDVGALVARCSTPAGPLVGGPSGLAATASSSGTIRLTWTDGSSNEAFTEVQMSTGGCSNFVAAMTVGANASSVDVVGLSASTTYCFRVRAGNTHSTGGVLDVSAWSSTASATTASAPVPYRCSADVFAWVDTASAASLVMADDSSTQIAIGFSFPFYGANYTSVYVGSNGVLGFGAAAIGYANTMLPTSSLPNGIAAVLWDDLSPNLGGTVSYLRTGTAPNRRFVASWVGVPQYNVAQSAVTFQAVLEESTGSITYQYLDTVLGNVSYDRGASATVGTETVDGLYGTTVSYNRASLLDRTSLRCLQATTAAPSITTTVLPNAHLQSAYSAGLGVLGGAAPYTWSIVSGSLPPGLSLATASGLVSGTPTAQGSTAVGVKVTDAEGRTATSTVTVVVDEGVVVATSSLPPAGAGVGYSTTLVASGGTAPYSWSASGVPGGMSLSSAGVLSGTPLATGTSTITVTVTDASSPALTGTRQLTLDVTAAPAVTTSSLAAAGSSLPYSYALASSGGTGTHTWSVASGALPVGATLSPSGVLSGTTSTPGTSSFTVRVTDGLGRTADRALVLQVLPPVTVATASLGQGTTGTAYSVALTASGGSGSYVWSATNLPPGLAVAPSTGVLSGIPTLQGTWVVGLTAVDAAMPAASATKLITLVVAAPLTVTTVSLPTAYTSSSYSTTLAASGGSGSLTWSLYSGTLPTGVALSSAGVLSGIPTVLGTFTPTIRVVDAYGRVATRAFTLSVITSTTLKVSTIVIVKATTSTGATGTVTVTVVNGSGVAVGSVTVTGTFTVSGITGSSSKSSTTSSTGVAVLKSNTYKSITGRTLGFCITSLAKSGFTFDRTGPSCVSIVI